VWAPKHELSAAVVFDGRRASLQQPRSVDARCDRRRGMALHRLLRPPAVHLASARGRGMAGALWRTPDNYLAHRQLAWNFVGNLTFGG
jgi:hypothetical protein